ncbi:farnesol dehydrogenase-like [Hylaeus volcanicus]|uniref:farnesol dehydrogenase-like n=1 Tax=Hylaeus volcanicus TaxID=313075 RepID=UPI0023B7A739|nr:farnesol dehydrogenase-like [Hylaeus volcanicus]
MDFWKEKTAIVTDASADIGAAIAEALMKHDVKVVGVAQTKAKLKELHDAGKWPNLYPFKCDVSKKQDIKKLFEWVEKKFGGADILVNNARIASMTSIIEGSTKTYHGVIETNIFAPAIFAREFTNSVRQRNASGHIININRCLLFKFSCVTMPLILAINLDLYELVSIELEIRSKIPLGIYGVSKYGLNALGTELRHELTLAKLKIKITNVSPGAVLMDMVRTVSDAIEYQIPLLQDKDIADAVIYALGTPQTVEIKEVAIMPQGTPVGFTMDAFRNLKV